MNIATLSSSPGTMNAFTANKMDALFTANVCYPNFLILIPTRVNDEHLVKGPTALKTSQVLVEVHYLWCCAEDDISFISPMFTSSPSIQARLFSQKSVRPSVKLLDTFMSFCTTAIRSCAPSCSRTRYQRLRRTLHSFYAKERITAGFVKLLEAGTV